MTFGEIHEKLLSQIYVFSVKTQQIWTMHFSAKWRLFTTYWVVGHKKIPTDPGTTTFQTLQAWSFDTQKIDFGWSVT